MKVGPQEGLESKIFFFVRLFLHRPNLVSKNPSEETANQVFQSFLPPRSWGWIHANCLHEALNVLQAAFIKHFLRFGFIPILVSFISPGL